MHEKIPTTIQCGLLKEQIDSMERKRMIDIVTGYGITSSNQEISNMTQQPHETLKNNSREINGKS